MSTVTATATRIDLKPADDYRRDNYGVLLESETLHTMSGRGVHNRSFNHEIQVWENRPSKVTVADPDQLVTPHGQPTEERYHFQTKAVPTVLTAWKEERQEQGPGLAVGDQVELYVQGFSIGTFTVTAGVLRDPILLPA
jgi:hypothetical protein